MKTKHLIALAFVLTLTRVGLAAGEEISTLVQDEYRKMQQDYQESFSKVSRRINELGAYRGRVIADSKRKAEFELQGTELLKKYNTLILSRYRNEQGLFEKGLEISPKDQDNIGKVLSKYLGQAPLQGRISAGEARRQLNWAMIRLQELSKTHLDPTEENNSELELIAYQLRDSDLKMKKISELAKSLGVEINETAVAEALKKEEARTVASPEKN